MNSFLLGLMGSITGGLMLATIVTLLFFYEKRQSKIAANKIVNDLKSLYYDQVATKTSSPKSNKLFN